MRTNISHCVVCVALAMILAGQPVTARAQTFESQDVIACLAAIKAPWTNGAGNAGAVQSGRRPAETSDQENMRADYLRYEREYGRCVSKVTPSTLQPTVYAMWSSLKEFDQKRPLLTGVQATQLAAGIPFANKYGAVVGALITYYYADSDLKVAELTRSAEQALHRLMLDELSKPSGQSPKQVLKDLTNAIQAGKAIGVPSLSVEAHEIAKRVAKDLKDKYPSESSLKLLRDKAKKPPPLKTIKKDLEQRGLIAEKQRVADKARQLEFTKQQTEFNEAFARRGELLSSKALWDIEQETSPNLDDRQRRALYDEYANADQQARTTDARYETLRGLTTEQAQALHHRADLRLKSRNLAERASQYATSFKATLSAAYAFDVGGPDLKRGLAAGALLADTVAQGALIIASSAAVPTPFQVFQFVGLAGNLVSGLNGIFGGGADPSEDAFLKQFAEFQTALFGALRNLSSQVAVGFALQGERFDRIERRLDVILAITASEMYGRLSNCTAFMRDYRGVLDLSPDALYTAMTSTGAYQRLDRCYEALQSGLALDQVPPVQFQTEVQLGLGVAKAGLSEESQTLREQGEHFVKYVYPELRFLLVSILSDREKADQGKADRGLGPFDLLTLPSASTKTLRGKFAERTTAELAARDVGKIYGQLGFEGRSDWKIQNYLRVHVDGKSTLTVLGALNSTVHLLAVTDDSFTPFTEVLLKNKNLQQTREKRAGVARGLVVDYFPLAANVLAQELLVAGDPIGLLVDSVLSDGDCVSGTDYSEAGLDPVTRDARRRKNSACIAVRESSLLALNLTMIRLKRIAAERGLASWALTYGHALESTDASDLQHLFGALPFVRLKDDLGADPAKALLKWHLKLAGNCEAASSVSQIGLICPAGSACRPPLPASTIDPNTKDQLYHDISARMKDRLQACVAVELPRQEELEQGRLLHSTAAIEADNILRGLYRKALLPTILNNFPPGIQPAIFVNF